jgi:hypothetical protein
MRGSEQILKYFLLCHLPVRFLCYTEFNKMKIKKPGQALAARSPGELNPARVKNDTKRRWFYVHPDHFRHEAAV